MNNNIIGLIPVKLGLIICMLTLWGFISRFDRGFSYFEYRYYCNVESNKKITISLKESVGSTQCLSYIKSINQTTRAYNEQIKIAQEHIAQGEFTNYRESYTSTIQAKLLQNKVLHRQIIKAMEKFETELFQKTMIYLNYRYKTTRKNLEQYVTMREQAIINATDAGESEDLKIIIQKHNTEKRKLEILNIMLQATNFNDLMPFYELYKKEGK